ncbi:MAG: leucine-rich repeat domain-containing protein [Mariniblastus sp.]
MFRFSLKKMLVLIAVLAVLLASFAYRLDRARKQAAAIQGFPTLDVSVFYDYEHDGWIDVGLDIPDGQISSPHSEVLVRWLGIDFFATINDVQMESSFQIPFEKLQPVFDLGTIEQFAAAGAELDSVERLSKVKSLKRLFLGENPIRDISPLSKLTNLISLNLRGTSVEDVAPLGELKHLQWLGLKQTNIKNIESLSELKKLTYIDLSFTGVSNIQPLSKLIDLEEVDLYSTKVTDLSPLRQLTNLKKLSFSNQDFAPLTDISFLHKLTNLTDLSLDDLDCRNIDPIKNCKRLTRLSIDSSSALEIDALSEFSGLEKLYLRTPQLLDISAIANHRGMTRLNVHVSQASDLSPLRSCTKLKNVGIHGSNGNFEFISNLAELSELAISFCPIVNLPLNNLANLETLRLDCTRFDDADELKHLTSLESLVVTESQIADFSALQDLVALVDIQIVTKKDLPDSANFPALIKLTNLTSFSLKDTKVKNFGDLPPREISSFDVQGSNFESFDFLSSGDFYHLDLSSTNFKDLSLLRSAKVKGSLGLNQTKVTDLTPLKNSGLGFYEISLVHTDITDFTPLASLPNLSSVNVSNGTSLAAINAAQKLNPELKFLFVEDE